jgi:hypothetical protein
MLAGRAQAAGPWRLPVDARLVVVAFLTEKRAQLEGLAEAPFEHETLVEDDANRGWHRARTVRPTREPAAAASVSTTTT